MTLQPALGLPAFFELPALDLLDLSKRMLAQRNASEQQRAFRACERAKASLPPRWPLHKRRNRGSRAA